MRAVFLALLVPLASTGCAQSPGAPLPAKAPGTYAESMSSGGFLRRYRLQVPPAYDGSRQIPLVVLLHGWTGTARAIAEKSGFATLADREGFALVTPEGLGAPQGWNVGFLDLTGNHHPDDAGFVADLIDHVQTEVGIDPNRIYVAGHSNGAMLAYLVGARYGDRLGAIGVVAGTIGLPSAEGRAPKTIPRPVAPVSAIIFHGTADGMVAYDRSSTALVSGVSAPTCARWWADSDGCGLSPTRTELSPSVYEDKFGNGRDFSEVAFITVKHGTHDWPGRVGPEGASASAMMWDFFKSHPRRPKRLSSTDGSCRRPVYAYRIGKAVRRLSRIAVGGEGADAISR